MRNLGDVIDEIIKVAPDLEPNFSRLLSSLPYSAPELIPLRWREAKGILDAYAANHRKKTEIAKIFIGTEV